MNSNNPREKAEAARRLQTAGPLGSNRARIQRELRNGLSLVVFAKEFDYVEYVRFGSAIASSVATSNPGPVLAYLQALLVESKQTFLKNLSHLPEQATDKASKEFEAILLRSLDQAVHGGRPVQVHYSGIDLLAASPPTTTG